MNVTEHYIIKISFDMFARVLIVVVCSWGGPDRMEGLQPRAGTNQSTFGQWRPPECCGGRQEEQPQLTGEEKSKLKNHVLRELT